MACTTCSTACSSYCSSGCTSTCLTTCADNCNGGCNDTCSGECSEGCGTQCNMTCASYCQTGCTSTCTATCADNCNGGCKETCEGTSVNDPGGNGAMPLGDISLNAAYVGAIISIQASCDNAHHIAIHVVCESAGVNQWSQGDGTSYNMSYTPPTAGTYTITAAARNTATDQDPGTEYKETSKTVNVACFCRIFLL